jgi:competence protein ComGC
VILPHANATTALFLEIGDKQGQYSMSFFIVLGLISLLILLIVISIKKSIKLASQGGDSALNEYLLLRA